MDTTIGATTTTTATTLTVAATTSNQQLSDRLCSNSDSGIENCSTSGNSSVLINNVALNESHGDNDDSFQNESDLQTTATITTTGTLSKKISSDSGSAFEIIDFDTVSDGGDSPYSPAIASSASVPIVASLRKVVPKNLDLSSSSLSSTKRHGSQSSEKAYGEMNSIEERDTFSPLNASVDGLVEEITRRKEDDKNVCLDGIDFTADSHDSAISSDIDNKIFSKKKSKPTSTKEEKQRQNEEIVIMETSSISSETGSWESIFPNRNVVNEMKDCCRSFLNNERSNCAQCIGDPLSSKVSSHPSTSSVTACFIDASTLLDESEIAYSNVGPNLPSEGCFKPKPYEKHKSPEEKSSHSESSDKDAWPKKKHLDTLENFHMSFELCKMKPMIQQINDENGNSDNTSDDSPQKRNSSSSSSGEENLNNLSDEEKLWKRENSRKAVISSRIDVKDQYNKDSSDTCNIFNSITSSTDSRDQHNSLSRQGTFEIDDKDIVRKRRDQERKQGNLVFQNSIQQYSGHLISPRMTFPPSTQNNFVEYSTSPGSIIWSENGSNGRLSHDTSFTSTTDGIEAQSKNYTSTGGTQQQMYCVLPDTPNNSIIQIETSLKRSTNDASCSGGESDSSIGIKIPKRRCDVESAPIVSGGASIKDFTPKQCESPPVRRKTETCPIVSGGMHSLDFALDKEEEVKSREKSKMSHSVTSWVVDMSDCKNQRRRRSTSSSSSTENTTARSVDASFERDRMSSSSSQRGGLGFYVSLNDIEPPKSVDSESSGGNTYGRSLNESSTRKSTGFYVDLSGSENSANATPPPSANIQTPPTANNGGDSKKNIFSMFIDFGDKKAVTKREPMSLASRLSSSLHQRRESDSMKTSSSSTETLMSNKQQQHQQHMFEKLDSAGETGAGSSDESRKQSLHSLTHETNDMIEPVIARRSRNLHNEESKRHSWNNSEITQHNMKKGDHKRSSSLSGDKGIMNILDKIPLISKTSSLSIDSPLSPFDDITCSKSELSTYSNNSNSLTSASIHSNGNDNLRNTSSKPVKKHRKDVKLNETFDKSSQGSITDGIFSKASSSPESTTDTEDLTFQQDENYFRAPDPIPLVKDTPRPIIMETILETKETSSPKKLAFEDSLKEPKPLSTSSSTHTMETLHATMEKQKQLLETVNEHTIETNNHSSSSNFVKLSDMDKPITKFELHSPESMMSKSVGNHRNISKLFQDNKTRPYSWVMTRSTGNSIANITSSVENLRSISRLFPHLTKEFSNSLPIDISQDVFCNRSPIENEYNLNSDISTESSLASSFSRSGMDESSLSCRQPRRLGEDLLKMFLQEIATDVIVEVNGRRIRAHKCILRSRCQYFAAMLAGGWVQSAGNVISLPGYSYSAVHFALCHIYSGASHPPEGISLMELAALADLLGLEGLKEVTAHALKLNYCHNFHKPCSGCIDGILQVLPVALNHALDDLYRKCLKWTCRHYLKVWPTRTFAQLPSDILGRCRQQVVAHLTSETVLETIMDCDHLISQLASCRWAIAIENLIRDCMEAAYNYASDHFASIIASDSFLSLGHDKSTFIPLLESSLLRIASSLNPDQSCRSYQRITRLNAVLASKVIKMPRMPSGDHHEGHLETTTYEEEMEWNEEFIRLVSAVLSAVEQCLIKQCARAMRITAWQRMDLELRKKIQKIACLTEPLDLRRGKPITKQLSYSSGSGSRTQDLYQVKLAIQAHSKKALAQDTQLYRATTHTQTHVNNERNVIQTIEKGVQANNEVKDHGNKTSKSNLRTIVPVGGTQQTVKLKNDKTKSFGHRRTQSEDSSSSIKSHETILHHKNTTGNSVRLSEIRPRYLEPRKPRGVPLKSATSSNIPSTLKGGKHISSSDSSRTSSPATNKRINSCPTARKIGAKSINMSLDSLTSPSKRSDQFKKRTVDNEISVDSLAESLKSSIRTDKTISQESLSSNKLIRSKQQQSNKENRILKTGATITATSTTIASGTANTALNKFAKNKSLSCQNTSGSSPSSITNKSSRLSSTTSSVNSPRDVFKNRSISVPAAQSTALQTRKSFFTPKSREILARKSAKQQSLTTQSEKTPAPTVLNNNVGFGGSNVGGILKCSSSSSIPTRKTAPPTTLHLRKTMKVNMTTTTANSSISPTKNAQFLKNLSNNKMSGKNEKIIIKKMQTIDNKKMAATSIVPSAKVEVIIENTNKIDEHQEQRIESKLERSSTFCKESSDLPVNELQIID